MFASVDTTELPSASDPRVHEETDGLLATLRDLPPQGERARDCRARIAFLYRKVLLREAGRYRGRGVDTEDLHQIAATGLMKAIAGFDPTRGKRFLSYLLPTVSGEIKRHFRDNTWAVHVPRTHRDRRTELNRFVGWFTQEHARSPSTREIGAHFDIDSEAVGELVNGAAAFSALSLDNPTGGEDVGVEGPLGDAIGAEDRDLERVVDRAALRTELARLPERERRALFLRYFREWPQTRIAAHVGCSQMQVSRVLRSGLDRLRVAVNSQN
ncbi:sigma-70 family RNA polymerase sigma factor [Nocardiopsis sp. MG754419]|uniref:sigma-70 family RNA polymerase sigma factor n=1 Tax=Nocardiopsis sp. MG754419 TaxID=2259865 RepID=UPI001BA9767A|nr:sigma-70 family RNA polymerase sigma factor [Nocardiopsis sp. MG754419]MBR8743757.1 B/F/G family RNA polymerase sigma-70 factor [Nocardiopsis sp. MG754419]